ncbi:MAG: carbon-nitrogen hydrolase family protein [Sedimentisphaerales bacterium]
MIAATGTSLWGILFLAIIGVGVVTGISSRKKDIKAAICQILIIDGDREGNLIRIENAIIEAKSQNAELICFPQASILGWLNPEAYNQANPIPGPDCDRLCEFAKKYKVHLCVGIEEKDGDNLYNSAILIDDAGQILLKHRQINVPQGLMNPPYTPGDDVGAIATKFGKIGLLVCSDTRRDDILDSFKTLKPALILVPYGYAEKEQNWPAHGKELEKIVKNAANRTGTTVIGANLVGQLTNSPWGGRIYGGQSIAVDKTGQILAIAKDRERDIKVVPIKLD